MVFNSWVDINPEFGDLVVWECYQAVQWSFNTAVSHLLYLVRSLDHESNFQIVINFTGKPEVDLVIFVLEADQVDQISTDNQMHWDTLQVDWVLLQTCKAVDWAQSEFKEFLS